MDWYIFLFILAAIMVIKPDLMWRIERIFSPRDEEPNEAYVKISRVGGICIMLYVVYKTIMG